MATRILRRWSSLQPAAVQRCLSRSGATPTRQNNFLTDTRRLCDDGCVVPLKLLVQHHDGAEGEPRAELPARREGRGCAGRTSAAARERQRASAPAPTGARRGASRGRAPRGLCSARAAASLRAGLVGADTQAVKERERPVHEAHAYTRTHTHTPCMCVCARACLARCCDRSA
jgi:hypothetical protein